MGGLIRLKIEKHCNDRRTRNKNIHTRLIKSNNKLQAISNISPLQPNSTRLPINLIPSAPHTPPPVHKMYWMDDKWDENIYIRQALLFEYTLDKLSFNQILLQHNHSKTNILMKLIPCLSKDTIKIISSFISEIDLCISKYALLDYSQQYIQFSMNDLAYKQIKKTMKIAINTCTSFTKQILSTIQQHHVLLLQTDQPAICTIYFHNNNNTISNGHYFVLSILCHHLDFVSEILCQYGNDNRIHFIKQINMDWIIPIFPTKPVRSRPMLDDFDDEMNVVAKYDMKYIYGIKDHQFYIAIYDSKLNCCQTVRSIHDRFYSEKAIIYFQMYDAYVITSLYECNDYLLISRHNCTKLELYAIGIGSDVLWLYHEFELKDIFLQINADFHKKSRCISNRILSFKECILRFEIGDHDILFCVYFDRSSHRLFAANIRLSMFKAPKLINYTLLDGVISNSVSDFSYKYTKCMGIEAIHTNEGKDWLLFCKLVDWNRVHETEFRVNSKTLKVKYGRKRYLHYTALSLPPMLGNGLEIKEYQKSHHRKQMSFSTFM